MNSSRRELIESLFNAGYENLIKFELIYAEDLSCINNMTRQCELILDRSCRLLSNKIFMHACPRDEMLNPGYSFAGIYNSYKPLACRTKKENIYEGLFELSRSKLLPYADYYYGRNHLNRTEVVDILISEELRDVRGSGTVYVSENWCLGQYFVSPISYFTREATKFSSFTINNLIEEKICKVAKDAYMITNISSDIEFVIDIYNNVYISEIRPISRVHLKNMNLCLTSGFDELKLQSSIINSVSEAKGEIVCIDESGNWKTYLSDPTKKIFVLNYSKASLNDFLIEIWKNSTANLNVIINYDDYIIDNHEQYMCYEDSGINFMTKTINEEFVNGSTIQIKSNGCKNVIYRG